MINAITDGKNFINRIVEVKAIFMPFGFGHDQDGHHICPAALYS